MNLPNLPFPSKYFYLKFAAFLVVAFFMAFFLSIRMPAYEVPIEVPEEAKLMCSNAVGLSHFTALRTGSAYRVTAHCINSDVVYRVVKLETQRHKLFEQGE